MYDTVHAKLYIDEEERLDLLAELPSKLQSFVEHKDLENNRSYFSAKEKNLNIYINQHYLAIYGSIAKWYLGDNIKVLTRKDTELAFNKLSDILQIAIKNANISRLDVANNVVLKHPIDLYFNYLGAYKKAYRQLDKKTLMYISTSETLCYYDKIAQVKNKRETVPELFKSSNVLRLEQRYMKAPHKALKRSSLTIEDLYNEDLYITILKRWEMAYKQINKVRDINFDFGLINNVTDLKNIGLLYIVKDRGGLVELLKEIDTEYKTGKLSRWQRDKLKACFRNISNSKKHTKESELLEELNTKVKQTIKFYR